MIKILALAVAPMVAAFVSTQVAPEAKDTRNFAVENEDRIFLAALDAGERDREEQIERADRQFLASVQAEEVAPVAVALPVPVAVAVPVATAIPRAIPVVRATAATPATERARAVTPGAKTSETNGTRLLSTPALTQLAPIEPEVRRAIPVTSHRAAILIFRGEVEMTSATSIR